MLQMITFYFAWEKKFPQVADKFSDIKIQLVTRVLTRSKKMAAIKIRNTAKCWELNKHVKIRDSGMEVPWEPEVF